MKATKQIIEAYPNLKCPWCEKEYEFLIISIFSNEFIFDILNNKYITYEPEYEITSAASYYPANDYSLFKIQMKYEDVDEYDITKISDFQFHHNCNVIGAPIFEVSEMGTYNTGKAILTEPIIDSFVINVNQEDIEFIKYPYTGFTLFHLELSNRKSKYMLNDNREFIDIDFSFDLESVYKTTKDFFPIKQKIETMQLLG